MKNEIHQNRVDSELLTRAMDGGLSDQEFADLDRRLIADPEFRRFYLRFLNNYVSLSNMGASDWSTQAKVDLRDASWWDSLVRMEENAPTVEIETKPEAPAEKPGVVSTTPASKTRIRLYAALTAVAALLFLVVTPSFLPKPTATLLDTQMATWQGGGSAWEIGDRLHSKSYQLTSGFARILLDSGTDFLVEGPAQFKLHKNNRITLKSGQMTAHVPKNAIGFTVHTRWVDIVDHGTDFGVKLDADGTTEAHVLEGAVAVQPREELQNVQTMQLLSGQAAASNNAGIKTIPSRVDTLTYEIPSLFEREARQKQSLIYLKVLDRDRYPDHLDNIIGQQVETKIGGGIEQVEGPHLGNGRHSRALALRQPQQSVSIEGLQNLPGNVRKPGAFAFTFWICPQRIATQVIVAINSEPIDFSYVRTLEMDENGYLQWKNYFSNGAIHKVMRSSVPLEAGKWHYVTIMNSVEHKRWFIVDNHASNDPPSNVIPTGLVSGLYFGALPAEFGDPAQQPTFYGDIADVVLYRRPVTPNEIVEHYEMLLD